MVEQLSTIEKELPNIFPVKYEPGEEKEWEKAIDLATENLIKDQKEAEIFAREAIQLLYVSEEKMEYLKKQGFLERVIGKITGINAKLQQSALQDITKAQKAAFQVLIELAKRNEILMNSVISLTSYAQYIHTENTRIRQLLLGALKAISDRFEKIEANIDVLKWTQSVKVKDYAEINPKPLRLLYAVNDFSKLQVDSFGKEDKDLFYSALIELGFPKKEKIKLGDFVNSLIDGFYQSKESIEYIKNEFFSKDIDDEILKLYPLNFILKEIVDILMQTEKYQIMTLIKEITENKWQDTEILKNIAQKYLQSLDIQFDAELDYLELAIDFLQAKKMLAISKTTPIVKQLKVLENEKAMIMKDFEKIKDDYERLKQREEKIRENLIPKIIDDFYVLVSSHRDTSLWREHLEGALMLRYEIWKRSIQLLKECIILNEEKENRESEKLKEIKKRIISDMQLNFIKTSLLVLENEGIKYKGNYTITFEFPSIYKLIINRYENIIDSWVENRKQKEELKKIINSFKNCNTKGEVKVIAKSLLATL